MSTPAQKANLARIRDNQRRSRTRRREYVQELEKRLRIYESKGVEATFEVQNAAKKVSKENTQLRSLLNQHGIGDDYISSYLNSGTAAQTHPTATPYFASNMPSEGVQTLQQISTPRNITAIQPGWSHTPLPQQSRGPFIAWGPTSSSYPPDLGQSTQPNSSYAPVPGPRLLLGNSSIPTSMPPQQFTPQTFRNCYTVWGRTNGTIPPIASQDYPQ